MRSGILFALALGLAGCVQTEDRPGESIDDRYSVGGASWSSGAVVYVFVRTFEDQGKVGICGAWSSKEGGAFNVTDNDRLLEVGSIELLDTKVLTSLSGFNRFVDPRSAYGRSATCYRSSVDWRPEFNGVEPVVNFGRILSQG